MKKIDQQFFSVRSVPRYPLCFQILRSKVCTAGLRDNARSRLEVNGEHQVIKENNTSTLTYNSKLSIPFVSKKSLHTNMLFRRKL